LSLDGGADLTIGVDLHFGALRAARRILAGESVSYARRVIGRHYQTARLAAGVATRVQLVCADALDPPLAPQAFERVVACNLLDAVHTPRQLLSVTDGLCAPGGELFLASPYAWQSGIVDETARLGGAAPEVELRRIFSTGDGLEAAYDILAEEELAWHLRRDARSAHSYRVHTLLGRKRAG
jgi:SAM-dependent methyltransferase